MSIHSATYSAEDNKIRLYASSRLDAATYAKVKALGFIWAPKQELFVAPAWSPAREDLAIELAGSIDAEEMTMAERAQIKAERLEGYAHKRHAEANAFRASAEAISERFAMGQPILMGHHSQRKAERDRDRMQAADLATAFAFCADAISTESSRYYICGIYLHLRAGDLNGVQGLTAVATDGHRLHCHSIPALVPIDMPGVIVPRKTVAHLLKLMGRKPVGQVKVTMGGAAIRFTLDGTVITSKVIDGTFPEYDRVVPRTGSAGHVMTVDADHLAETVKAVASVSPEKGRAVAIEIAQGKVAVRINNPGCGSASAAVAATVSADAELTVGFNASYVQDICAGFGPRLSWQMVDGGAPALITSEDQPRGFRVLMPMRV